MAFDASEENNARARLIRLRDVLSDMPAERFRMETFGSRYIKGRRALDVSSREVALGCDTAACLAGWTCAIFATDDVHYLAVGDVARRLPGLSEQTARALFIPWMSSNRPTSAAWQAEHATPQQAARVLTHLLNTNRVDWSKAFEDTPAAVSA